MSARFKQASLAREEGQWVASDIANRLLCAAKPDDRWRVIKDTLAELGATSVNATAICTQRVQPFWFRSSLPSPTREAYVRDGFAKSDFILRHAARSIAPLRWRTNERSDFEADSKTRNFADFVRDSGERSIVCLTARYRPDAGVSAITYCSTLDPNEAMHSGNLLRIETTIRLLLPWLDWPDGSERTDLLPPQGPDLSKREIQALRLLAGGLKNARIADAMGISEAMVQKHLRSARSKLGAKTREEAVAIAVRGAQLSPSR